MQYNRLEYSFGYYYYIVKNLKEIFMKPIELVKFMETLQILKDSTRHCWLKSGRQESVAEHSWRLAVMAMLVGEEIEGIDTDKLIRICLIHDLGETITGDIPTFNKTEKDEVTERELLNGLFDSLPSETGVKLKALFDEYEDQSTPEGKLAKALDKLEALDQHNLSDISTWLPLEYDLQLSYGEKECNNFEYTKELRSIVNEQSLDKINKERGTNL